MESHCPNHEYRLNSGQAYHCSLQHNGIYKINNSSAYFDSDNVRFQCYDAVSHDAEEEKGCAGRQNEQCSATPYQTFASCAFMHLEGKFLHNIDDGACDEFLQVYHGKKIGCVIKI